MSRAGMDKAAALLLALGEEAAAAVFRCLGPLEVSQLGSAMREMDVLPRERVREILRDYAAEAAEQTGFAADTRRFLDDALKQALSPERAREALQRISAPASSALDLLAWRPPAEIAGRLEPLPAGLAAVVVAQLPRDVAAATLELLPPAQRADTLQSLAQSDTPSPDMLAELDAWLAGLDRAGAAPGEAAAATLLAQMSPGSSAAVLNQLDQRDAGLAARLRVRNVGFDDLARLPEAGRKTFLRNIGASTLLHALKGSDGRALEALVAVMSPTAAQRLRDDLDTLGAVPVTDIQDAQEAVGESLRRMLAEGAIHFPEEEAA
jgi:flagellar motor switch protein FliG